MLDLPIFMADAAPDIPVLTVFMADLTVGVAAGVLFLGVAVWAKARAVSRAGVARVVVRTVSVL
ncbi:hypothetical protein [Deinococcus sp. AJ005]|uniref:hypothetical protein n=1 Tax=Deinococcus sp. AJ005 TaxID=2652443 RepID=UPI0018657FED|nr:hypothetical protein [Deinococcus sp. AJ005]